ncbi:MAG: hypothetical protein HYX78_01505 [Armatimonadetes bacterium]|nr:hypothetical protein [Armatimonadota bacterium]
MLKMVVTILLCASTVALAEELPLWGGGKPVCTEPEYQAIPVVVSDGQGGAIIAWVDYRNGNYDPYMGWANGDIYAQRVDSNGNQLWQNNGVAVCIASGEQYGIQIAPDGSGGAIIAWNDSRGGGGDVYAQRISPSGTALWTQNGLQICAASGSQYSLSLAVDSSGGAAFAWSDSRRGLGYVDIYAQYISPSGTPAWTANGVPVCTASSGTIFGNGPAEGPQIISDGAGGWVIAWYDYRNGTWDPIDRKWTECDIYTQKLTSSGSRAWTVNGVLICNAIGDQYMPVLVSDGAGGAIVAWNDVRVAFDTDIYAQRIISAGSPAWAANGVPVAMDMFDQLLPAIVTDGAGGAVIAWEDYRTDIDGDIYAQRIAPSGNLLWEPGGTMVAMSFGRVEYAVKAARDPSNGDIIVVWSSWQESTKVDVFAQRLTLSGNRVWGDEGTAACDWPANQQNPAVTVGSTGPIVVWDDDRTYVPGTPKYLADIYVQRFGAPSSVDQISEARLASDGTPVILTDKVVTAAFPDFFYIEESDRSSGIKVVGTGPGQGRLAQLEGVLETADSERQIRLTAAAADRGPGVVPKPLAMPNRSVGGSSVKVGDEVRVPGVGGPGLNNIGLLVTVFGRVGFISDYYHWDGPHFYIDDGSGLSDGSGNTGLRIIWNGSNLNGSPFVKVTGIASCVVPYGMTTPVPVIRPRSDSDIVIQIAAIGP